LLAVADGFKQAQGGLGMLTGARLTNEELFLLKNLAKVAGTANLDHSGGECYKGLSEGVADALGVAASTGTFPQVEECDTILAIRSDFYETHPVFGMVVNQAVKRNDARLWLVADKVGKFAKLPGAKNLLHRPGMELDVLNGLARVLLDEGLALTEGTDGLAELKQALTDFGADQVAARTGVDADTLRTAARQLAAAKKSAILLAYGLPYTAYSRELGIAAANLAILAGIPGRAGSGLYLCGEKANSQGAIDLGILPQSGGLGAQAMLDAAAAGKLGALYVVGEDLLTSYPDRNRVEKALDKVPFLVVQDIFLSPTAAKAHVVLPAASFAEKDGTFTNAERRIQRVRPGIPLPGQARTDGAIFTALVEKLCGNLAFTGPAAIFAEIGRNVPAYAEVNFNGIGPQGFVWGGEILAPQRRRLQAVGGAAPVDGAFQLLTGSALYHSGTVSTRAKGPQAVVAEAYIEFGREDAKALQLKDGDLVKVAGNGVELRLKAKLGNRLPKGVLFAPYHFAAAGINRIYKGEAAVAVTVSK